MRNQVNIWVDPGFEQLRNVVCRTLEQLIEISGWRTVFLETQNNADLEYSSQVDHSSLLKSAGKIAWSNRSDCRPVTIGNSIVPSNAVLTKTNDIDIVLAGNTILTGYPERCADVAQYAGRDMEDHGVPGRMIRNWGLTEAPLVNILAQKIKKLIEDNVPVTPAKPRWPNGKSWAFCLTHDCDRISRFRTKSFLRDAVIASQSLNLKSSISNAIKGAYAFAVGLKNAGPDPYLTSWQKWIEFERENQIRGTYFIASWNKYSKNASLLDVPYSIENVGLKKMVDDLLNGGNQIGLHNSVNAWNENRYAAECDLFEAHLGIYPEVYRGHCWSLDSNNPEKTMCAVSKSTQMTTSSCLGMNLIHGYRRGLNYPYRPFDRNTGEYSKNWEIPPTMMDQSLLLSGNSNTERINAFRTRTSEIREAEGCFVLDWHTDSLWSGYMADVTPPLLNEIKEIANDSSCWTASLGEIVNWCRKERWQTK